MQIHFACIINPNMFQVNLVAIFLVLSFYSIEINGQCTTKKGLVFNWGTYCGVAGASNCGHYVNFRTRPDPCFGVSTMHFPTIWKSNDIEDLDQYLGGLPADQRPEWVLGYNEPNFAYGGITDNIISPQDAALAWRRVIEVKNKYGFKLTSPSPVPFDGGMGPERYEWYRQWFEACNQNGIDCLGSIDAFGVHSYEGWEEFINTPGELQRRFGTDKPTFYSEVCQGHWAGAPAQLEYMRRLYSEGDAASNIVKIFWNTAEPIPGDENVDGAEIFTAHEGDELTGTIGQITPLGLYFRDEVRNC